MKILEMMSPIIGLLCVIIFNFFFPSIQTKIDLVLLIGFSLTFYGFSMTILSAYYAKSLKGAPELFDKLKGAIEEMTEIKEAEMIVPAEICLQQEQTVTESVHVLTHDLSWNIDEVGTPKLMFNTILFNLRRGIKYVYVLVDASKDTKDNLGLLKSRLEENLSDRADLVNNFSVRYVEDFPLLFSFALFDIEKTYRANLGFILIHTLEKPMAIPMNRATLKQARSILNAAIAN